MIILENDMKSSIGTASYKIPGHQFVTSSKLTGSSYFAQRNLPIWAEAMADPKLISGANKRVWDKFGIGMDWAECLKNKRSFDIGQSKKYLEVLTKNVKNKKPFQNQSLPLLKKMNKNTSLSNSQLMLSEVNYKQPVSSIGRRNKQKSNVINGGSYKMFQSNKY